MSQKLEDYTEEEWENICTHCGKCCLLKLQDDETEEIFYTDIVCKYYDQEHGRCSVYENRCELVPECLKLTKDNIKNISWMPDSCAYRRLAEGREPAPFSSIKGRCISETEVSENELEDHIVDWDDL